jgi:hypothetical protein
MSMVALPVNRMDLLFEQLLLIGSVLVLALAASLQIENGARVVVPSLGLVLPEVCTFRRLLDLPCAGCGLTRSFISLAHGDFLGGLSYHPMGPLLFAIVMLQPPTRCMRLWQFYRGRPLLSATWINILLVIAVVGIMGTGLVRWLAL